MENSRLSPATFSDATHEEAKQYVKSSALIVLKLPAINSLCSGVMVLSCFRPRGFGNTGALSVVLSCTPTRSLFRPRPRSLHSPPPPIQFSPSSSCRLVSSLPSFLPSSLRCNFSLLALCRHVFAIDVVATSEHRRVSPRPSLNARFKRGKLNSFYLFIRAVVSSASLSFARSPPILVLFASSRIFSFFSPLLRSGQRNENSLKEDSLPE